VRVGEMTEVERGGENGGRWIKFKERRRRSREVVARGNC